MVLTTTKYRYAGTILRLYRGEHDPEGRRADYRATWLSITNKLCMAHLTRGEVAIHKQITRNAAAKILRAMRLRSKTAK